MSTQITVDLKELQLAESKLSTLQKSTANRKLTINISQSKGSVADELRNAATQLNEIGTQLALLICKTETAVKNARVSFENADSELAKYFGITED